MHVTDKLVFRILKHECTCTPNNIHIKDSYQIPDEDVPYYLSMLNAALDGSFQYKRTVDSWAKEWITHNKLYKAGLFTSHTKDVDLNEDESKFRLIIYNIFGR